MEKCQDERAHWLSQYDKISRQECSLVVTIWQDIKTRELIGCHNMTRYQDKSAHWLSPYEKISRQDSLVVVTTFYSLVDGAANRLLLRSNHFESSMKPGTKWPLSDRAWCRSHNRCHKYYGFTLKRDSVIHTSLLLEKFLKSKLLKVVHEKVCKTKRLCTYPKDFHISFILKDIVH